MKLSIGSIKKILNATVSENTDEEIIVDTQLIQFDSRKIDKNGIFIALKTTVRDGADFIPSAMEKGALLSIAQSNPQNSKNVLVVPDSLQAFQRLGQYVRENFSGTVIGITGSSGKTTCKELIGKALSAFGKTFVGEGSLNNHIGVPYNLCRIPDDARYAVLEMGMDKAGEISTLTHLILPNIAAIVNVYPMHMENFKEFKDIAFAKSEIFEGLTAKDNEKLVILNADTSFAKEVLETEAEKYGANPILTFGTKGEICLLSYMVNGADTQVRLKYNNETFDCVTGGIGERFAYNVAFVAAMLVGLKLDIQKGLAAISDFGPLKGRGKVSTLTLNTGIQITLIDDSYNGQPEAIRQAVITLGLMEKKSRKIALMGKMAEIGAETAMEHRSIGETIAKTDIDIVIGVGAEMQEMLSAVPDSKEKIYKETVDGVFDQLLDMLENGDIILVKGSHYSSKVFTVVDKLLEIATDEI